MRIVCVLACFTVALCACNDQREAEAGGPLVGTDAGVGSSIKMDIGDRFSFSGVTLWNNGSEPAVLERVQLVDLTSGLRLLDQYAEPGESAQTYAQYPPPDTQELAGFVIEPEGGEQPGSAVLYVGMEVTAEGTLGFRRVRVHYRVGNQRFVRTADFRITLCVPSEDFPDRCPSYLPDDDQP